VRAGPEAWSGFVPFADRSPQPLWPWTGLWPCLWAPVLSAILPLKPSPGPLQGLFRSLPFQQVLYFQHVVSTSFMGPQNFCIAPENEPSGTPNVSNVLTLRLLSWYHLGTLGSPARHILVAQAAQPCGTSSPADPVATGQACLGLVRDVIDYKCTCCHPAVLGDLVSRSTHTSPMFTRR